MRTKRRSEGATAIEAIAIGILALGLYFAAGDRLKPAPYGPHTTRWAKALEPSVRPGNRRYASA